MKDAPAARPPHVPATVLEAPHPPQISHARRRPVHRPELQGLRAVAIGMVVIYHVFLDRVSGGVDVFLLISAFLLTGSFIRRMEEGRPLGVVRFWIKTFKRLVPPAAATIVAVLLLMYLFFPAYRWREILSQSLASAFYVENWHLARAAVDYYAVDRTQSSPLQHFWSLSIQGQVFLLWPLLFLLAAWLIRRQGWPLRTTLAGLFGSIFVVSLGWSIWETATAQSFAYFDTRARLWEFALGSLVAIGLPLAERFFGYGPTTADSVGQPLRTTRILMGWLGLAGMLSCGLLVSVSGAFPGWIALWPLLSACLVIAAGRTGSRWGVDRWLAGRRLTRLGDASYALYLVHWPLLVTMTVIQDTARPALIEGIVVIAISLRLAFLLTTYVDAPVRARASLDRLPGRAVVLTAVCLAMVVAPVSAIRAGLDRQAARALAGAAVNNPGAAVLTGTWPEPEDPHAPVVPLPEDVLFDWTTMDLGCRGALTPHADDLAAVCGQSATGEAGKVIVAVGDSRTQQYMGALRPLAEAQGYTLVALLKGACPYTLEGVDDDCARWNQEVTDYVLQIKPAAIFTTTTRIQPGEREHQLPGAQAMIATVTRAGVGVIGLRDQPRMPSDPIACVEQRSEEQCTVAARGMFGSAALNTDLARAAVRPGAYYPVDLVPWICPEDQCPPVIGKVFVYLDRHHLSQMYARTLAPMLDEQLSAAGWRW